LNIETQFHKRKQPLILEKCAFSPEAILWACLMLSSKFLESTQKQLTLKTACHLPDIPDSQGGLAKAELFVFSLLDHNVDFRPTGFFPFIELFLCNMDDAILQAKIFQIAEQLASLLTIAASEKIFESASSQHIAASIVFLALQLFIFGDDDASASRDALQGCLRDLASLCLLCDSMKAEEPAPSSTRGSSVSERAEDIVSLSEVLYQIVLSPLDVTNRVHDG